MTKTEIEILINSMEDVIQMLPHIPEKNCTCHLGHPPCDDCVEYSGLRQAVFEFTKAYKRFVPLPKSIEKEHKNRLESVE